MTAVDQDNLAVSVMGLVRRIARQVSQQTGADYDELISDGHVGAVIAANAFNPTYENTFATYAAHRIHGAMLDGLRERDHLSRAQRVKVKGDVDDDRWKAPVSISAPLGLDGGTIGDVIPALDEAFDDVLADLEAAHWAVQQLPPVEYDVVVRHYWHEMPLHEIGDIHGFTESRACQIEAQAIHRMRVAFLRAGFDIVSVNEHVSRVARRRRGALSAAEHGAVFGDLLGFWGDE